MNSSSNQVSEITSFDPEAFARGEVRFGDGQIGGKASHFFHNVAGGGVSYLSVRHDNNHGIDREWLQAQPFEAESEFVRHVRLEKPLKVKVDRRSGQAGVWR